MDITVQCSHYILFNFSTRTVLFGSHILLFSIIATFLMCYHIPTLFVKKINYILSEMEKECVFVKSETMYQFQRKQSFLNNDGTINIACGPRKTWLV